MYITLSSSLLLEPFGFSEQFVYELSRSHEVFVYWLSRSDTIKLSNPIRLQLTSICQWVRAGYTPASCSGSRLNAPVMSFCHILEKLTGGALYQYRVFTYSEYPIALGKSFFRLFEPHLWVSQVYDMTHRPRASIPDPP